MSPRSRASEPAATVCGRHLVTRSIAVPGSLSGGLRDRHLESEGLELADVAARGAVRMSPVEIVRTEFLVSSTVAHDVVRDLQHLVSFSDRTQVEQPDESAPTGMIVPPVCCDLSDDVRTGKSVWKTAG